MVRTTDIANCGQTKQTVKPLATDYGTTVVDYWSASIILIAEKLNPNVCSINTLLCLTVGLVSINPHEIPVRYVVKVILILSKGKVRL